MNKKGLKYLIICIVIIGLLLITKYSFGNNITYFIEERISYIIRYVRYKSNSVIPGLINYIGGYNYLRYGLLNVICFLPILGDSYGLIISIMSLIISIILIYYFLRINKYKEYNIFIVIMYLLLIRKLIINIHDSLFIYYVLPFIIMSFIGAYKRVKNNNSILLSISIFLISITNYTYLLPTIIVLLIYGIFLYLENNYRITIKKFIKYIVNYSVPILIGILISSVVLIPVIYYDIDSISLNINLSYEFNIIYIFSIIYGLFSSKRYKYLSVIVLLLNILFNNYNLCFIILECILVCNFIKGVIDKKIEYNYIIISVILSIIYIIISNNYIQSIELVILLLSMFIYLDKNTYRVFLIPVTIYILLFGVYSNYNNMYIKEGLYNISNKLILNKYLNKYSEEYILDNNVLYNIISDNNYTNKDMINYSNSKLSLGISTNDIMSYEDYNKLNSLQKEEVLLSNIVVDKKSHNDYVSNVKEINIEQDRYYIKNNDNIKYTYKIGDNINNTVILVEFLCKKCNGNIKINDVRREVYNNKIYRYTLSNIDNSNIYFNLSRGEYDIRNIKIYSLDYASVENNKLTLDKMKVIKNSSNIIEGNIKVSGDGYFMFTIPYEKYYKVYLDGNEIKYELVDNMYIGFPISKGNHNIKLTRDNKFIVVTIFVTYVGLMFLLFINYFESRRKFT